MNKIKIEHKKKRNFANLKVASRRIANMIEEAEEQEKENEKVENSLRLFLLTCKLKQCNPSAYETNKYINI